MIKKTIVGCIKTLSGLHIGSGDSAETTDSPLYRNVGGEIVIPGTALAGSLRALAARLAPHLGNRRCNGFDENTTAEFCDCPVCGLFGSINNPESSNEGIASKIWFYDAVLEHNLMTSIRDGVGIDRETRASAGAARAKFDYEVIPKGSRFSFRIVFHDALDEKQENILVCALKEWTAGRGYLGGNKARGLGNIKLEDVKIYSINMSNKETLMKYLKETDPLKAAKEEKDWLNTKLYRIESQIKERDDYLYNSFVQIDFTLKFIGGFAINDALKSLQSGFDVFPKMEQGSFMVPGSSLRGVVRSHAEKIARTMITLECKTEEDFLKRCPACNPFSDQKSSLTSCNNLFKDYKRKNNNVEIRNTQLCPACQFFGNTDKGSRLYFSDAHLTGPAKIKIMDFLAIDRFTGGGKEGAKFDAIVLWHPSFKTRIFMDNPKNWHLGWLMLVLKDLNDGLISFGFGQNKWFGKATTDNETIKFGAVSKNFMPDGLSGGLKENGLCEGAFYTQVFTLKDLTSGTGSPSSKWINSFCETLLNFQREDGFYLRADTYFRDDLAKLYPQEVL